MSYYNINSGFGRLVPMSLTAGIAGKMRVVAKDGLAYRQIFQEIFGYDADGSVRFFSTVDAAISSCTSGGNDVVYVLPGHTETVTATSIAHDVAGVSVIGLGEGDNRPIFTFGAAAATITVSAANASWKNCRFVANFLNVASAFTLTTATGFTVERCNFEDTSAILNFLSCVVTSANNAESDGLRFLNNYVYSLPTTDGPVVSLLANEARVEISDNVVIKAATNNAGHLTTFGSKIVAGIRILRNILICKSTNQSVGILFTGSNSNSSGICGFNHVFSLDTTTAILATTGTGISFADNRLSGAADASGTLTPAADDPA